MEFEAPPIDQQEPLYMSLHKGDISDASSEEEGRPSNVKKISKSYAISKQPGDKKVSMHSSQLKRALFSLFQARDEFKINELSNLLQHPVAPLKATLKEIADFNP